ncbi:hypothetical protein MKZ17_20395 [Solibacillus sp. FSL R7-0682]|jgi:hypothetical protein|uniref:hypothetical protein n=1 Tax=Solibacillus sp. FSL R7-0682 TaxID=2921690 RepID=UPI0030F5B07C
MKKILFSIFSLVLIISSFAFAAPNANAEGNDEELVNELAEALQFAFEEAALYDLAGNVIGLDTDKIAEKFGDSVDTALLKDINKLNAKQNVLKDEMITPFTAKVDACINTLIMENYGWMLGTSALTIIYDYLKAGEFTKAAGYLVKIGFKGSVPGIAVNLSAYFFYCLYTEEGWI